MEIGASKVTYEAIRTNVKRLMKSEEIHPNLDSGASLRKQSIRNAGLLYHQKN